MGRNRQMGLRSWLGRRTRNKSPDSTAFGLHISSFQLAELANSIDMQDGQDVREASVKN